MRAGRFHRLLDQVETGRLTGASHAVGGHDSWPRAVLFDLDGTLIDSAPDLAASTNRLLLSYGRPALGLDQVRSMIGHGVRRLVERAFAASGDPLTDERELDMRTGRMMEIYGGNLTAETRLMPGARMVLEHLTAESYALGVVTNKPEALTRRILTHFGLDDRFGVCVGGDTGPACKPAPDMLVHAMQVLGLDPSRGLLVGDSPADIHAAKSAGMISMAVRGGYTNIPVEELGSARVLDSLHDLPSALRSLIGERKTNLQAADPDGCAAPGKAEISSP